MEAGLFTVTPRGNLSSVSASVADTLIPGAQVTGVCIDAMPRAPEGFAVVAIGADVRTGRVTLTYDGVPATPHNDWAVRVAVHYSGGDNPIKVNFHFHLGTDE